MAHSGPLLSFSFQCADFVLHTDNTPNACYHFTLQCRNFLVSSLHWWQVMCLFVLGFGSVSLFSCLCVVCCAGVDTHFWPGEVHFDSSLSDRFS
jgi:hypothetical protein